MSGAIATAYVKLIPTFDKQLKSSIAKELGGVDTKQAGNKVGRLFTRNVDQGMSGLKTAMTSRFSAATVALGNLAANVVGRAFSAVGSSMDSAIRRVDTINNLPRIMEGMGIGAEASAAAVKRLSDGIDGLPTALDGAVSGVQRFTAKNGDIDRSTEYFLAVNNAIASGGQSMEIQSSALEQLSQSYSKGKMDMMEWRSLQQAMPAQLNQVAKAMGMTADQLGEGLRNGNVSMDAFMDKIVQLNKEGVDGLDSFEQQARKATAGIGTALTNVQNRVNKAVAGVLDAIGQENISGAINAFSSQFANIGRIVGGTDSEGNMVGFVTGLKRGLESAFDGWEPRFSIDWGQAFEGAIKAAERAGELLAKPVSTFVKSWDEGMAQLGGSFQEAMAKLDLPEIDWGAVADGVSDVVAALTGFGFDVLSNAVSTAADIAGYFKDYIGPAVEALEPALDSAARAAQDFATPIAEFVTGNGPVFEGLMWTMKGAMEDMAPVAGDIATHISNIAERLEPLAGPLGEQVASSLGFAFEQVIRVAEILFYIVDVTVQRIDELLAIGKMVGDALSGAASDIGGSWNPLLGVFGGVITKITGIDSKVRGLPTSTTAHIYAEDHTGNVLGNIASKLATIAAGAVANVSVRHSGAGGTFAAGGISLMSLSQIPRHADGGLAGIADRATLTNVGWVGEAGAEAIIPLSNRRYVGTFARAVAAEMPRQQADMAPLLLELQALHRDMARMRIEMDGRQVGRAVTGEVSRNLGWEKANADRGF